MKKSPTNTTKQVEHDPTSMLLSAMLHGGSGAIEHQEAQGQRELVNSEVLPIKGIEKIRAMIESNGGSIGEPVEGDALFIEVQLPSGWSKKATGHSMWSDLLDEKGRKRAGIFYKAAFYDRSAHIGPDRRFGIDAYSHDVKGEVKATLTDACGEVSFDAMESVGESENEYDVRDRVRDRVAKFLDENYPDWEDPNAYWA